MSEQISGLLGNSVKNLRDLIDVNTIIGNPITTPDGTTIIPVSKVTFGFGSGGSDIPNSNPREAFGGGGGAGVTIHPLCFLVSRDGDVKIINITESKSTADRVVNIIPEVVDRVSALINKKTVDAATPDTGESASSGKTV